MAATVWSLSFHAHVIITDGKDSYRLAQATAGKGRCPSPDRATSLDRGEIRGHHQGEEAATTREKKQPPVAEMRISCRFRGWCHRPGRGGQSPASESIARAMTAQGEW